MADPIVTDGNTPLGFDTLEAVGIETPEPVSTTGSEEKTAPVVESKSQAQTFATDDDSDPTVAAAAVETKTDDTPAVEEKAEPEVEAPAKSLKFKVGPRGKEVDLDLDAKTTVKIDGAETEVTLADLKTNYAGKVAYDKKFTDLDKERQAFDADKTATEEQLDSILSNALNKKPAAALLQMAEIAGIEPAELYEAFREEIVGDLEKFMSMTEQERKIFQLEKEKEFLVQGNKAKSAKQTQEQTNKELERQAAAAKEALGLTDEWISKAQTEIKSKPEVYNEWLKGKQPNQQQLIALADGLRRWDLATQALNAVDPELAQDPTTVEFAAERLKGQKVTLEQAVEVARKFFKREATPKVVPVITAKDNLIKKVQEAKKVAEENDDPKAKSAKNADEDEIISWDDL